MSDSVFRDSRHVRHTSTPQNGPFNPKVVGSRPTGPTRKHTGQRLMESLACLFIEQSGDMFGDICQKQGIYAVFRSVKASALDS